jgi:hypothetical protein
VAVKRSLGIAESCAPKLLIEPSGRYLTNSRLDDAILPRAYDGYRGVPLSVRGAA